MGKVATDVRRDVLLGGGLSVFDEVAGILDYKDAVVALVPLPPARPLTLYLGSGPLDGLVSV